VAASWATIPLGVASRYPRGGQAGRGKASPKLWGLEVSPELQEFLKKNYNSTLNFYFYFKFCPLQFFFLLPPPKKNSQMLTPLLCPGMAHGHLQRHIGVAAQPVATSFIFFNFFYKKKLSIIYLYFLF
jgi:hypothetical protein